MDQGYLKKWPQDHLSPKQTPAYIHFYQVEVKG